MRMFATTERSCAHAQSRRRRIRPHGDSSRSSSRRTTWTSRRRRARGVSFVTRASFDARLDLSAIASSLVIVVAFAYVNAKVMRVERVRKDRKELEIERRRVKARRLRGDASADEEDAIALAIEANKREEGKAREVLGSFAVVRDRADDDDVLMNANANARERGERGTEVSNASNETPMWITFVSAFAVIVLTCHAIALSASDRGEFYGSSDVERADVFGDVRASR